MVASWITAPTSFLHSNILTKKNHCKNNKLNTRKAVSLSTSPSISSSASTSNNDFSIKLLNRSNQKKIKQPKKKLLNPQSRPSNFLYTLYKAFVDFLNPPLQPYVDPKRVFVGNYAPVDELSPTECLEMEGELPLSLDGAYIRNGPNPQYYSHAPLHFLEGDGMLHSLKISCGKATFCSRYVKTYKYNLEKHHGFPIFPKILSGFYNVFDIAHCVVAFARMIGGQIELNKGFGLANTSISFFGNKIFAHCESDLPYSIRLTPQGDIETIERFDFNGSSTSYFINMTAHPKVDPDSGKTYAFQCSPLFPPYLRFFQFDRGGSLCSDVPIMSMESQSFIHDFAVTKHYAVFVATQIEIDPFKLISCKGMPLRVNKTKVPKIGVIPKDAVDESDMMWFPILGFNPMHIINAWEENDEIVLVAPNAMNLDDLFQEIKNDYYRLEKVKINTKTGSISRAVLSTENLELGSVNPNFVGKKCRYAYMGVVEQLPKLSGVVKIDLENEQVVASKIYGSRCFGGELFFVAREAEADLQCEEDEGFLISYVHDESTGQSRFVVLDAKSSTLASVASVKLPNRVPYGFHGLFLRERDLFPNY